MDTQPGVSVVVPMYNSAGTVGETLASVVAQTVDRAHLELILVDDGSSDDGLAVASRVVADSDVSTTVLTHDTNRGASAARNTGWNAARFSWLQFLDADDLLEPIKCELQLSAALGAPQDTTVVYSPWGRLVETQDGGWLREPDVVSPRVGTDQLLDVLRADNFLATSSYLLRRDAVQRVGGYDGDVRIIQDVTLLVSLAIDGGRFVEAPSDRPVAWYRQRAGSLSRSNQTRFVEECLLNARRAEAIWRAAHALTDDRRRVLADVYYMSARHLADAGSDQFDQVAGELAAIAPDFVPAAPAGMRRLSRWLGYETAEQVAVKYRRTRKWMGL